MQTGRSSPPTWKGDLSSEAPPKAAPSEHALLLGEATREDFHKGDLKLSFELALLELELPLHLSDIANYDEFIDRGRATNLDARAEKVLEA